MSYSPTQQSWITSDRITTQNNKVPSLGGILNSIQVALWISGVWKGNDFTLPTTQQFILAEN
jgi:hypothetical protein